jgi:hypothetical protein
MGVRTILFTQALPPKGMRAPRRNNIAFTLCLLFGNPPEISLNRNAPSEISLYAMKILIPSGFLVQAFRTSFLLIGEAIKRGQPAVVCFLPKVMRQS